MPLDGVPGATGQQQTPAMFAGPSRAVAPKGSFVAATVRFLEGWGGVRIIKIECRLPSVSDLYTCGGKALLHTQSWLCAPFGQFQVPPLGWRARLRTRSWLCGPFGQFPHLELDVCLPHLVSFQ